MVHKNQLYCGKWESLIINTDLKFVIITKYPVSHDTSLS